MILIQYEEVSCHSEGWIVKISKNDAEGTKNQPLRPQGHGEMFWG